MKTDSNAEYLRSLRAVALAAGKCGECRCRDVKPGRRACSVCLDKHTERRLAYQAVGLCKCGADPGPDHTRCTECHADGSRSAKKRYEKRIALGICTHSSCRFPRYRDCTLCALHLELGRKRSAEWNRRKAAVSHEVRP